MDARSEGGAANASHTGGELARVVGVPGAVLLGLGSVLGTGIFVGVGLAAGVAGPAVLPAAALAAVPAILSGLSSAQLAASHPVSGGTYEYGYRYLNAPLGFTAGWTFLWAKSASAAAAALGLAGYAQAALGTGGAGTRSALALAAILVMTVLVAGGLRRSSRANAVIVLATLVALLSFVARGSASAASGAGEHLSGVLDGEPRGLLHATALMFVAYTGYARVATLGEEVKEPRRSIPRAIVLTLLATLALYVAVAFVAVGSFGAAALAEATASGAAPLAATALRFGAPGVARLVEAGAVAAMLGVLLNLLLGLSRVLLAMARRGDVPRALARVAAKGSSPRRAVLVAGALTGGIALAGGVRTAWSFSAFSVLVYYALTNLAALRLPPGERLCPRWVPGAGLLSCLGLAFWVEPRIWCAGLALIAVGLGWHAVARRRREPAEG